MQNRVLLLGALVLALCACTQTRYLAQAAGGQVDMLWRSRPIPSVLRDPSVPAQVRGALLRVRQVKAFAIANGLEPSESYERYTDLKRSAAVWVVQACAPYAFEEQSWQFPIVGSVPYLGFFAEADAHAFAAGLSDQRTPLDVDVRTASAYSTLGWFRDPVLSTMIPDGPEAVGELANVILHESVHATLYVNDQSAFDESLASFVADRLTVQWLHAALGPNAAQTRAWVAYEAQRRDRLALLRDAYAALDALYQSSAEEQLMRTEKARILRKLEQDLGATRPINNATLSGVKKYASGEAAFQKVLDACGGRWPQFLAAMKSLETSDFPEPQMENFDAVLDRVAATGCADE